MKIFVILLMAVSMAYAADVNDVNELALAADINEIPAKVQALEEKTYIGTISQILSVRIEDINQVEADINDVNQRVHKLACAKGMAARKSEFVQELLNKHTKIEKVKSKHSMAAFVQSVADMSDLNPADPNYTMDVETRLDIVGWLFQINETEQWL